MSQANIRLGIYQHYKGNNYEVIDTATHSETMEIVVIYRPLYGAKSLWVRPLKMFNESLEVNGIKVKRFQWKSDK